MQQALDGRLVLEPTPDGHVLRLHGHWALAKGLPPLSQVLAQLDGLASGTRLNIDALQVQSWDSSLPAFIRQLSQQLAARSIVLSGMALPPGVGRLLALARPAPPSTGTAPPPQLLERIGRGALSSLQRIQAWCLLAGMIFFALGRLLVGQARVPVSDIVDQIVECGPRALPIVGLLSFLIGAITAFVGVIQLRMFGAEIYVADLVGMGMLLEMGALMTGVIMAGRAGAAFAAAIGTMQTNEEVDALQTLGFDPVEFLVLPRVLALTLMAPLLTLYADFVGIMGGALVGLTLLDLSPATYFTETASAVHLSDAVKGLIKATCYGALIGFAGCLRGIECGRSAQAVGQATTSAVVTSIVLIVLSDSFITVLYFIYDGLL
jgi:phospholipid/cholesterol/gamma-HCH transport system permease protein